MADESLRQLLASFVIEVDRAGELAKGNAAIDALKKRLEELAAAAKPAGKALDDVFAKAMRNANAAVQAANARAFGGPANADGFLAAGLGGRSGPMVGPTRNTLNAYRSSLRGRVDAGVASFKEGFAGSSGLSGAIGGLATLRNGILALGAGAAVHALTGLVDRIGDISESAARLGVTVEEFQRLDVLAKQNGTSVGALGTAFRTLANAAVDPTKESTAAFAKLNVATKDGAGAFKTRQDLFFDTAGALADVSDGTERAVLAQKLFGRGATELLPLLDKGRAGLEAQREALMQLPVFTEATVTAADELSDSWKTLGPQLLAAAGPLITKLLIPGLKLATELLVKMSKEVVRLTKGLDPVNILLTATGVGLAIMTSNALAGVGSWAKLAGSVSKAALQFAKIAAAFFIIEDFVGFVQGKDSVTGLLADKLFGPGGADKLRADVQAILDTIKAIVQYVTGGNVNQNVIGKAIGQLTGGPTQATGPEKSTGNWEDLPWYARALAKVAGVSPESIAADRAAAGIDPVTGAPRTIPLASGQYGPEQLNRSGSVSVGDTTVIVNGVNPNNASAVAGAVSNALGRDRAAIMSPYAPAGAP